MSDHAEEWPAGTGECFTGGCLSNRFKHVGWERLGELKHRSEFQASSRFRAPRILRDIIV